MKTLAIPFETKAAGGPLTDEQRDAVLAAGLVNVLRGANPVVGKIGSEFIPPAEEITTEEVLGVLAGQDPVEGKIGSEFLPPVEGGLPEDLVTGAVPLGGLDDTSMFLRMLAAGISSVELWECGIHFSWEPHAFSSSTNFTAYPANDVSFPTGFHVIGCGRAMDVDSVIGSASLLNLDNLEVYPLPLSLIPYGLSNNEKVYNSYFTAFIIPLGATNVRIGYRTRAHLTYIGTSYEALAQGNFPVLDITGCTSLVSVLATNMGLEQLIGAGDCFPSDSQAGSGGLYLSSNNLSETEINKILTEVGTAPTGFLIDVTNNPGAATCNPSIAIAKGWIVYTGLE